MKANAPEKIYINDFGSELSYDWHTEHCCESDIEYTRNDAFIEKLKCWMNENFYQYTGEFTEGILAQFDRIEDAINSFRKYMKG